MMVDGDCCNPLSTKGGRLNEEFDLLTLEEGVLFRRYYTKQI